MTQGSLTPYPGGLLRAEERWPPSRLRFLIKNSYGLVFAVGVTPFSRRLFRIYWGCTRNNLSLSECFCISLFLKAWQNIPIVLKLSEPVCLESLRVQKTPARQTTQPDLCAPASPVPPCSPELEHAALQELPGSFGNKKARVLLSFFVFLLLPICCICIELFFSLICVFCPYFDSQFSANKPINIPSVLPCSSASSSKLPRRFSGDQVLLQNSCFLLISVTFPVFGCLLNYVHQQSINCRSPPACRQGCLLSHLTGNSICVNFQL